MGEFDLIERYFKRPAHQADVGVGDDCAVLALSPGMRLAVSTDMLVEGRHFLSTVPPERLGHKALAVNLSDLAACGASPRAFTLSLSLPRVDEAWLAGFSKGLLALADAHGCELIGGDTTQGPLTIGITVLGEVPPNQALLRSGAQAGDELYVSGTLGDARVALELFRGTLQAPESVWAPARQRMECPTPRVALGLALRGVAHAAIDVSDGLLGDLGHILRASGVGARIEAEAALSLLGSTQGWRDAERLPSVAERLDWVLAGGDDYELAFTAPPSQRAAIAALSTQLSLSLTRIGTLTEDPGLVVLDAQGQALTQAFAAFDHFKTP